MIGLDQLYAVMGVMFAAFAISHAVNRVHRARWRSAGFWGCFALSMGLGSWLSDFENGILVLIMAGLASVGLRPGPSPTTTPEERRASANRLGNRLFIPALVVPLVTVGGTLLAPDGRVGHLQLVESRQVTLASLVLGALVGLLLAILLTRAPRTASIVQGKRLLDSVGWAMVLPQMLAALGAVFAVAGVGKVVAQLVTQYVPIVLPTTAVVLYTCGMAVFTIIMGNAFAAFPLMTVSIGLPIIVDRFGGDPAIMSALGMLSGFCGTLLTPMAANFNIVPAAILELHNRYAVIAVQAPSALFLLAANTTIMAIFVYHT